MDERFYAVTRLAGTIAGRFARRRLIVLTVLALLVGCWLQAEPFGGDGGAASAATARATNLMISTYVPLVCTATSSPNPRVSPAIAAPSTTNLSVSVATPASVCSDGSQPSVAVEQSSGVISAPGLADTAGASSYVEPNGTRVLIAELALDGRASPVRLVTVTY